jgi:hypothetical protein
MIDKVKFFMYNNFVMLEGIAYLTMALIVLTV